MPERHLTESRANDPPPPGMLPGASPPDPPAGTRFKRAPHPGEPRFDVGDTLVLAQHGAGTVVERSVRDLGNGPSEYLTIELHGNSMTLRLPTDALERACPRPVASSGELVRCLDTIQAEPQPAPARAADRHDEARRKIGSGQPQALAEVVRDLAHLAVSKPLSRGDRALYFTARALLESELMTALDLDRSAAAGEIDRRLPRRRSTR